MAPELQRFGKIPNMTDAYYPVIEVRSSYVSEEDEPERLGSKSKFWFRREDGARCLFKFPRHDFGEHWAEKVAAEIGALIGVRSSAEVQLARYDGHLGSMCVGFAEPEWLRVHGNEIMAEVIPGYRGDRTAGSGDHNIRNILLAVGRPGTGSTLIRCWPSWRHTRYWTDWLEIPTATTRIGCSSTTRPWAHTSWLPPMTTALRWVGNCRTIADVPPAAGVTFWRWVECYTISWGGGSRRGVYIRPHRELAPPPLLLAKLIGRWRPQVARPWLERLEALPEDRFRRVLDMVPDEFISETARGFAYQVIATSRKELLRRPR